MSKHESIWAGISDRVAYPALASDETADVAIIGGGITGLTAAVLLKRAGRRVVVLEKDRIGAGTSGLTTAHASSVWDHGYQVLGRKYGEETCRRMARAMESGIDCIAWLVEELSIACSFERLPGYHYAELEQSASEVKKEFEAAQAAGLPVSWVEELPLAFRTSAAFRVEDQAQLHALDYLHGLAANVDGDGCNVYERTRVTSMSDDPCEVRTEHGTVRARRIIAATHTPLGLSPLHMELSPQRSFVLAARVRDDLPAALFWDADEPYHYLRRHISGSAVWLIAGGKDRKTAHGEEPASSAALRDYVNDRFEVIEIGYEWAAQLYEPSDHLPFIGRSPFNQNVFLATGFSGDGIPLGSAAAMILTDLVTEKDNRYADLFSPERLKLKSLPTLVKENLDVAKSFLVDRLPGRKPEPEIDQLARGEGRVVGRGTSKLAVYRNKDGSISRFSAVCPHMKCVVRWNEGESTFDCPCHGSRFDKDGSVIEGPALEGLSKVE